MRLQDKIGSLEAGKIANFMVLNKDIFEVAAEDMMTVDAEYTYFDGEKRVIKSDLTITRG